MGRKLGLHGTTGALPCSRCDTLRFAEAAGVTGARPISRPVVCDSPPASQSLIQQIVCAQGTEAFHCVAPAVENFASGFAAEQSAAQRVGSPIAVHDRGVRDVEPPLFAGRGAAGSGSETRSTAASGPAVSSRKARKRAPSPSKTSISSPGASRSTVRRWRVCSGPRRIEDGILA